MANFPGAHRKLLGAEKLDKAIVIAEVTKAGFVLEAEGDFLRDPADTMEVSSGDSKIPTDKFVLRFVKR